MPRLTQKRTCRSIRSSHDTPAVKVRYSSVNAALERGIRMNWTANGTELEPFTDPQKLFDHLFLNLSADEKRVRRDLIERNGSIFDAVSGQFAQFDDNGRVNRTSSDWTNLRLRSANWKAVSPIAPLWVDRDKPKFDISEHFSGYEVTVENRYNAIFDMIAYAFQTDMTRVASVGFPNELKYTDIEGVTRSYHGCTHNGQNEKIIAELVAIESFQIAQLSRCMKKLDAIPEPNADGIDARSHDCLVRKRHGIRRHALQSQPADHGCRWWLQAPRALRRQSTNGVNMPLCNLYVTLMQRFGIERDKFNTSTGAFELAFA